MQKLLIMFVAGAVVGGGGVALVRVPPPPAEHSPGPFLEQRLLQSEAKATRLAAEIELLQEDRELFEVYETPALSSERATDGPPPNDAESTDLYSPVDETSENDRIIEVADLVFRERLSAHADEIYSLLAGNPEEAEARRYLKQARDSYIRAGSPNQAIKMQEELLQGYPDPDPYRQLVELASLKNRIGEIDDAISVLNEAVNITPNTINKLNGMRRAARYKEQRFGSEAGLTAWRELEQYANSVGQDDSSPARKARTRIEQLERAQGLRP